MDHTPHLRLRLAAAHLDVHPETLRRWARAGEVPYARLGARGDLRFRLADLDALVERRSSDACDQHVRPYANADGFTLVETLVVVLVLAVLIAVALSTMLGSSDRAHDSTARQTLAVSAKAAKAEWTATGERFPASSALLLALTQSEPQYRFSNGGENYPFSPTVRLAVPGTDRAVLTTRSPSGRKFCVALREGVSGAAPRWSDSTTGLAPDCPVDSGAATTTPVAGADYTITAITSGGSLSCTYGSSCVYAVRGTSETGNGVPQYACARSVSWSTRTGPGMTTMPSLSRRLRSCARASRPHARSYARRADQTRRPPRPTACSTAAIRARSSRHIWS